MTWRISATVHCLRRLSLRAIRVVPRKPATFALTLVVWREASTTNTLSTGIWFARARARIGSRISGSARAVYLLKAGAIKTGKMKLTNRAKSDTTAAAQIHQVLGAFRKTA